MTLLGLILAIGIVVDDAIVVVEGVEHIMETEHLSPYEATKKAMNGLASALIATSLVLAAVFVPVSFLSGITGQLYRGVRTYFYSGCFDTESRDVFVNIEAG